MHPKFDLTGDRTHDPLYMLYTSEKVIGNIEDILLKKISFGLKSNIT